MVSEEILNKLEDACSTGNAAVLSDLLRQLSDDERDSLRKLKLLQHTCAKNGSLDCLRELVLTLKLGGDDLNRQDEAGQCCLHLAAVNGGVDTVNFLLESGVDVNLVDGEKHTPLYWAVVAGQEKLIKHLIEKGADVGARDNFGANVLHYAVQVCEEEKTESVKVVKQLIEHMDSVDQVDGDGRSPLVWACSAGTHTAVDLLVKSHARVALADKDGLTALHCAASHGYQKAIDVLVGEKDCVVDVTDSYGCTPLFYAVTHQQLPSMRQLVNHGANLNHQDKKGRTASHCAAEKGQVYLLHELEERGADLWLKSNRSEFPLHEALANQHSDASFHLFDRSDGQIDLNATNKDGLTYLHLACKMGSEDLINYLIDKSVDINAVYSTKNGPPVSALDICDQNGYKACVKLLQKYGAKSGRPASRHSAKRQKSAPSPSKLPDNGRVSRSRSKTPTSLAPSPSYYDQYSQQPRTPETAAHVYDPPQSAGRHSPKKEVKIVAPADSPNKENKTSEHREKRLPDIYSESPTNKLYGETLLPYDRMQRPSFVNVSTLIRRPKTAVPKRSRSLSIKEKIRESVSSYTSIRKSARDLQKSYLMGPRPISGYSTPHSTRHSSTNSSEINSTTGRSTPSFEGSSVQPTPTYTVIATRGGFTKIRNPQQSKRSDREMLHNLQKGKGNGILYVMDTSTHDTVGFTQGYDGRLRPRVGLVLRPTSSDRKTLR